MIAAVLVLVVGHAVHALPVQAALAAIGEKPAAGPVWPDGAYRVDWEEAHIPAEVATSSTIAVAVAVRNTGDRVWPASQVFVSYHWLRDGRLVVWDGKRTLLPRDLRAGSRAPLSVQVATPADPGSYVLILTLVHEHVTWFEHRGATPITRSVVVRPSSQTPECRVSGSSPCPEVR
jgi:hypothetical protein